MPRRVSWAAAVSSSVDRYSATKSGCRAATASTLGLRPSPTLGTARAAAGKSHHVVRPTTRSPAPKAKRISVKDGDSDTTRRAGAASVTVRPASSGNAIGPRAGGRAPLPHAARASNKPARWGLWAAGRIAKNPTPDGAEMGKRLRRAQHATIPPARELQGGANGDVSWLRAPRLAFPSDAHSVALSRAAIARYSGGAAPDSHRLP